MLLSYQWILGWYGIVLEFIWQICNLILITYLVLAIYLLSTYIWISIYIYWLILNSITFVRILHFCNVFLSYNLKKLGQGSSKFFAFSAIIFSPHFPLPSDLRNCVSKHPLYKQYIPQKCFICLGFLTAADLILPFYIYRVTWNEISKFHVF